MKKVSVIIPAYNVAEYIRGSLLSVIHQDYTNTELIVVDDGSTDGTLEICRSVQSEFPDFDFVLLHQENKGVSAARNVGLDRAAGDYILFLDGDDAFSKGYISNYVSLIESCKADIVCGGHLDVSSVTERDRQADTAVQVKETLNTFKKGDALRALLEARISPSCAQKIFRASAVQHIRFYTGVKYNEDKFFLFQVMLSGVDAVTVDYPSYICLDRPGSATKKTAAFNLDLALMAGKMLDAVNETDLNQSVLNVAVINYFSTILYNARLLFRRNLTARERRNYYLQLRRQCAARRNNNVPIPGKLKFELQIFNSGYYPYSILVRCTDALKISSSSRKV